MLVDHNDQGTDAIGGQRLYQNHKYGKEEFVQSEEQNFLSKAINFAIAKLKTLTAWLQRKTKALIGLSGCLETLCGQGFGAKE
ncbi:hypothetical protein CFP56_025474 [Quercus suber]|uniref:Uncharacterized protein n=1 Tax=Quercus suber TaxID=58331 RepID=A0AAW0LXG6_QUESU